MSDITPDLIASIATKLLKRYPRVDRFGQPSVVRGGSILGTIVSPPNDEHPGIPGGRPD